MTNLQIDFSTQQEMSTLNGVFTTTGVKRMLVGNDFSALVMLSLFIGAFLNVATAYESQPILMDINTIYSDTVNEVLFGTSK